MGTNEWGWLFLTETDRMDFVTFLNRWTFKMPLVSDWIPGGATKSLLWYGRRMHQPLWRQWLNRITPLLYPAPPPVFPGRKGGYNRWGAWYVNKKTHEQGGNHAKNTIVLATDWVWIGVECDGHRLFQSFKLLWGFAHHYPILSIPSRYDTTSGPKKPRENRHVCLMGNHQIWTLRGSYMIPIRPRRWADPPQSNAQVNRQNKNFLLQGSKYGSKRPEQSATWFSCIPVICERDIPHPYANYLGVGGRSKAPLSWIKQEEPWGIHKTCYLGNQHQPTRFFIKTITLKTPVWSNPPPVPSPFYF